MWREEVEALEGSSRTNGIANPLQLGGERRIFPPAIDSPKRYANHVGELLPGALIGIADRV